MVVTGALADFSAQLDVWQKACQQKIELKKGMGVWIDPHHLQRLIKHAESAVSKKTPHHNLVKALLTHLLGMEKYLATNAEKMDRRLLSAIVGYVNNRYPDLTQPVERYFRCINLNRGYLLKRKLEAPTHYPIKKHRILEPVKKSSLKQISEQRIGKIDEVVKNKSKAPALISKISKPTGFNSLASMSPFHDSDSSKLTTSSTTLTTSSRSIPLPATSNWGFPVVSSMVPNGSSRSVSVVSNSTVSGSSRSVPVMPSMSMRSIPVPSSTPASGVWAVNSNSGLGVNSVSVPWVPAISTSVSNGHGQVLSDSVLNVSKSTVGSTSGGVLSKAQVIYVRRNTSSAKGGNIPSEVGQPKSFPVFSSSISSKTIVDMGHIHNVSGQNNYTPRFGSVFKTNSPEFNARSISASTANTQPQNIVSPALSSRKVMSTSDSMQNRTVRPTFQSIFSSAQRISNSQSTFTTVKVPSNVSSMSQLDYLKYLPPSSSS